MKTLLLIGLTLFGMGCTQSDDGPMPAGSGLPYEGTGFYLEGVLADQEPIAPHGDSIMVQLSRMWILNDCSLRSLELADSLVDDTLLLLEFVPRIVASQNSQCASRSLTIDTSFYLPWISAWDGVRSIHLLGIDPSFVYPADSTLDSSGFLRDSLSIRYGSLQKDEYLARLDSTFSNWNLLPRRHEGDRGLLRVRDSLWVTARYLWVDSTDTITLYDGDSLLSTLSISDLDTLYDTSFSAQTYYFEKVGLCVTMGKFTQGGVSPRANNGIVSIQRSLFLPDPSEPICGPQSSAQLLLMRLDTLGLIVQDSLANFLREEWSRATLADSIVPGI